MTKADIEKARWAIARAASPWQQADALVMARWRLARKGESTQYC